MKLVKVIDRSYSNNYITYINIDSINTIVKHSVFEGDYLIYVNYYNGTFRVDKEDFNKILKASFIKEDSKKTKKKKISRK